VAHRVVELLVAVKVDHHAGEIFVVALRFGEQLIDHAAEMPAVVDAGQRVRRRHLLELRVLLFELTAKLFLFLDQRGDGQVLLDDQRDR
jgi:hypothetical protein